MTTRQRQSRTSMPWAWTCSSRQSRRATAEWFHPRPKDAHPVISPPGTGCGASCRPGVVVSAARCGWRRWSQSSARSTGPGLPPVPVPRSGEVQGEWSLICTGHNPESSSGQALLKLFRFGLPANTGGPKPGRRTVHPSHWLRSIPLVSQPTTRHPSHSLGR